MSPSLFRNTLVLAGATLASLGGFGAAADCCSADAPHIRHMVQDADLVFAGEVIDIQYALSLPSGPDGKRIPYTFVTYRVDEVLRGQDPGDLLTLRFIGGVHEEAGLYLRPTNAPQFDRGDDDILFVKGNAEAGIPLVGAQRGRLRMIDGQIYTEAGESVQLSKDGAIIRGSRYLLEEVATTEVTGQLRIDDLGPQALTGRSDAMGAGEMLGILADMGREFGRRRSLVASADPSQPFAGPDMTPAAPPAGGDIKDVEMEGDNR